MRRDPCQLEELPALRGRRRVDPHLAGRSWHPPVSGPPPRLTPRRPTSERPPGGGARRGGSLPADGPPGLTLAARPAYLGHRPLQPALSLLHATRGVRRGLSLS